MKEGSLLEMPNTVDEMDSTDVEIKEEVGELFIGNEESPQTVFPTGLILINDQPTVGTTETHGLSYTSIYNDKTGTPSFLQASDWKCSIVQRNESMRDLEVNEPREEGDSEFVRRFRVLERMERDPLAMSTTETCSNLSQPRKTSIATPGISVVVDRIGVLESFGPPQKPVRITVIDPSKYASSSQSYRKLLPRPGPEPDIEIDKCTLRKFRHLEVGGPNKCRENGCNKSYINPHDLKRHMRVHSSGKTLKCDECEKEYSHRVTLYDHKRIAHSKTKREHKCEECGKILVSISALELHMGIHTGVKKYKCLEPGCDKTFVSLRGFKDHKDSYHGGKKYKCEECEKVFTLLQSMRNHKKKVHSESPTSFEEHKDSHTGERKHKCDECGNEYVHIRSMVEHKRIVHANNRIIHKCEDCEKEFAHPSTLKNHKMTVHSQSGSIFQCKLCEKSFTRAQRLTDHCTREHSKPEENKFKCSHCDKTFGNERDQKTHILIHEKRFKCQKCEEAFSSTSLLRKHVIFKHRFDQDIQEEYWQQ